MSAGSVVINYTRPYIYPKQLDAIFCPERYSLTEASTKSGKTHGCIVWIFEQALGGRPGQNYWWVAPVYPQARIAYARLKQALSGYKRVIEFNDADLFCVIKGAGTIWFKSAEKPDNLYGDDVYAAVMDEASRIREESWHAVRSTLTATQGPIRLIGNVKGRKNFFYKLARLAQTGERKTMHYAKLTAYDAVEAGILPLEEVEDAKFMLPEDVFRELYLAEPSEDGGNPFGGEKAIMKCVGPMSTRDSEIYGVDVAKSGDWTVIIGLDSEGVVSEFHRFKGNWNLVFGKIRSITAGASLVMVDSTGAGDPILERLQEAAPDEQYEGYIFSVRSKQQLMENLAVGIQKENIKFPRGQIVDELLSYEYEYTRQHVVYTAPEGMNDDCVCALALAYYGFTRSLKEWAIL